MIYYLLLKISEQREKNASMNKHVSNIKYHLSSVMVNGCVSAAAPTCYKAKLLGLLISFYVLKLRKRINFLFVNVKNILVTEMIMYKFEYRFNYE